ncbi:transporter [Salinimicrobium tongyeongense]|uniref:Transporter n=1 Tax=Salinimicrobium tongyeongense TaxID=2809707 RepID=A0ABY6NND5_9FLAO|nr:transporter [Salinimicrobium tongyeongense]UZH54382.1 transporter [Salinimicrobium tongyeongense]
MKRLIFAFTAMISMTVEAQNITDAVRYSTTDLNGTARYRAMSGAFGALGGDLSSLNVNPAGSAVFLSSFASLSLNVENSNKDVSFMNGYNSTSDSNVDLGQAGAVFIFNNFNENANWKKFSLGFNFNKSSSFNNSYSARGNNPNSIDQYFLAYANGIAVDNLIPYRNETDGEAYARLGETLGFGAQQAYLGLWGGVIGVDNPNNLPENDPAFLELDSYSSILSPGTYDQIYTYTSTGLNGKLSFNFASQYQDFLYLGINLNSHFINYERMTSIDEENLQAPDEYVYFEDQLTTLGSGFSLQLGALAKIGSNVRAGLAYESPTWYTISEETNQYIETDIDYVEPNIVNIYPDYKLQTPASYTGSLAYLFGSSALLSFDYTYKDYSTTKFKPTDDPAFMQQNNIISNELGGASKFRFGGEYRIQNWSLRGGYRFEETPYKDELPMGDLEGYSAGIGYSFGSIKIDFAYDHSTRETNPQLYQTGLTDRMGISGNNSNYVLTIGFGL